MGTIPVTAISPEAYEADDVTWELVREQQKVALYHFEAAMGERRHEGSRS